MLGSLLVVLALGRTCPSSMCPHSMCVHAKARTRNQQTSNGKKEIHRAYERGIKQISMIDMASKETRKQTNKRERKQKVGSTGDKCRFGSNFHNFIVLKYG